MQDSECTTFSPEPRIFWKEEAVCDLDAHLEDLRHVELAVRLEGRLQAHARLRHRHLRKRRESGEALAEADGGRYYSYQIEAGT